MLMSEHAAATRPHTAQDRSTWAAGRWLWVVGAFFVAAQVPAGATQKGVLPVSRIKLGEPLQANLALLSGESGECLHAEVAYGEKALPVHLVRTSVPGGRRSRFVRVESDAPIDEPFVTVTLGTGCIAPSRRVFSLLPDPAGEVAVTSASRASKRSVVQAKSRLKVEPWDERTAPALGSSDRMSSPSSDPQVRATAIMMRAAVFQSTEQSANAFSQADRLEAHLALLQERERRRSIDIAELRSELDQVGSWPISAWIAASVILLLSAASVAAALLVPFSERSRRRLSGWPPATPIGSRSSPSGPEGQGVRQDGPSNGPTRQPNDEGGRSQLRRENRTEIRRQTSREPANESGGVEELLAVLQELELLAILSSWSAGIDALQRYVTACRPVSPLPFLAFLRACNEEHARDAVTTLYEQVFSCPAPGPMLLDAAWGLERHPRLVADVVARWGTAGVPQGLALHLFARPCGDDCLALEAGLELVFLLELDASRRGEPLRTQPTITTGMASAPAATQRTQDKPEGASTRPSAFEFGPRLGFDIDLDDIEREVSISR